MAASVNIGMVDHFKSALRARRGAIGATSFDQDPDAFPVRSINATDSLTALSNAQKSPNSYMVG